MKATHRSVSAIGAMTAPGLMDDEYSILDEAHRDGVALDDLQWDLMEVAWNVYGDEDDDAMESFMDETWNLNRENYETYLVAWDALPLHMAAGRGDIDTLRELLDEPGRDLNLADADGNTPLHLTAWNDHGDCSQVLISAGADVNALNHTLQSTSPRFQ